MTKLPQARTSVSPHIALNVSAFVADTSLGSSSSAILAINASTMTKLFQILWRLVDPMIPALQDFFEMVRCVWRKVQLFTLAFLHLWLSTDKQMHSLDEQAAQANLDGSIKPEILGSKRIIFVRHAESQWNVLFNRKESKAVFLFRLIQAVLREWLLFPMMDSIFLDSPLSKEGTEQARKLQCKILATQRAFLSEGRGPQDVQHPTDEMNLKEEFCGRKDDQYLLRFLCCAIPKSIVVSSNLRRAINTAAITSASRLAVSGDRLHVLSCLQEIGENVDTLALSQAKCVVAPKISTRRRHGPPSSIEEMLRFRNETSNSHKTMFDSSENHGNKAILGCAYDRLKHFALWAIQRPESVIVVYGHSLWFQRFCQCYLPKDLDHPAKRSKLGNSGVVSFRLQQSSEETFHIDPDTFSYH
uniref:Uncharacterized protein AlNc14C8G1095 n=1 Tax=Albugo laibachii Nc14 TaxID=890382 RepID=F0W222_9STRA|nr:conserved hypothetical protein [Albugo laibachii Nc14]|eukprot:CCA15101.1 conserved hypothetical protein [Albugo laibachii Nc14]